MAQRYDVLSVRESNGKSYFTRLGVAFENKAGDGFNLLCDAIPAPQDGQYKFMMKIPQDKQGGGGDGRRSGGSGGGSARAGMDDNIPFGAEVR